MYIAILAHLHHIQLVVSLLDVIDAPHIHSGSGPLEIWSTSYQEGLHVGGSLK